MWLANLGSELVFHCYMSLGCFFFFFQAEDGIRDIGVTGVQTCALPISFRRAIVRLLMLNKPARPPRSRVTSLTPWLRPVCAGSHIAFRNLRCEIGASCR